jgi:nitrate/TMAO reductase-like tetraheme cytochrome c subunit
VFVWLLATTAIIHLATLTVAARQAQTTEGATPQSEECLVCHSEPIDFTFTDQSTRTLKFTSGEVEKSVHASVACADCHPGSTELPHPEKKLASSRQFTVAASEQCRQCHFDEYRHSLESVHAKAVARGDLTAPVCVDCHGSHDIQRATEPRTRVADMCGSCHTKTASVYAASVHGQDVAKNITDVPTCTDCHGGHQIAGPGDPGWRNSTPEVCGNCHGDESRMEKYGLSANVLKTYLADFHGKTSRLRSAGKPEHEKTLVAVCSDCHGTHDVTRADSPSSPVVRANLTNTCRNCHSDASTQFPDAWMSHYEPSWGETPVVKAVQMGYAVLIPFIIGGMMLQVLLHLWRMAVNR